MAELQQRLAERRRNADVESAVFDGSNFKEQAKDDENGRMSISGRDAQQVLAFRSGWTQAPKVHDWTKPKFGYGAPQKPEKTDNGKKYAETLTAKENSIRQDVCTPSTSSAPPTAKSEDLASPTAKSEDSVSTASLLSPVKEQVQSVRTAVDVATKHAETNIRLRDEVQVLRAASERNQEHQIAQKERLDKLMVFAIAENQKLDRLLVEARSDSDQQTEQIQKLLESKAKNESIITTTRQTLTQLEERKVAMEGELEAAKAQAAHAENERATVEQAVRSARAELENSEIEKRKVEARASAIEAALAEAHAASAELQQKADGAERLQKLLDVAESEKVRLERLLATSGDDKEVLSRQKAAVEASCEQVRQQNAKLQEELKDYARVKEVSKQLEAENERLKQLAQDAEARAKKLEEIVEKLTEENQDLQKNIQEVELAAGLRAMGLEGRIKTLEQDKEAVVSDLARERKEREAVLAEARTAGEAERTSLLRQLDEVKRENEDLKLKLRGPNPILIEEGTQMSARGAQSERRSVKTESPQPKLSKLQEPVELSTTAFGSLLDSWLSVLTAANEEEPVLSKLMGFGDVSKPSPNDK